MQRHRQAGITTTNIKIKIYFTITELSATTFWTWNCHVDDSSKGRYDMILGRYILIALGLYIKISIYVTESDTEPFKGSMSPTVNLGVYEFKYLNAGKIAPK